MWEPGVFTLTPPWPPSGLPNRARPTLRLSKRSLFVLCLGKCQLPISSTDFFLGVNYCLGFRKQFYFNVCVFACVCLRTTCMQCEWKPEEGAGSPGTVVPDSHEPLLCRCWESKPRLWVLAWCGFSISVLVWAGLAVMVNIVNLIGLKSADQVSKGSTLDVYMRAFPQRTKAGSLSLNVVGSTIPAWEPER